MRVLLNFQYRPTILGVNEEHSCLHSTEGDTKLSELETLVPLLSINLLFTFTYSIHYLH